RLVGPEVPAELDRLGVTDAIVVGGADAVSQDVIDALKQRGIASTRIAGADRYDTAAQVADAVGGQPSDVVLASGVDGHLTDALAAAGPAGTLGWPVLLTGPHQLPPPTGGALDRIQPR